MLYPISWTADFDPENGLAWRLYAALDENERGRLLAEVPIAHRLAEVNLVEGEFIVRIVPISKDGREAPWELCARLEINSTGREWPLPALANVAIGAVDPLHVRLMVDPPSQADDLHRIQVVEVPAGETTPELGMVISEHETAPGGPMAPNMPRIASPLVPVEGAGGSVPTTRRLAVRAVGPWGSSGAATVRDVVAPERPGHYRIAVASMIGGTLSGFPAAAATDSWETDATDGVRLRALPTVANLDANWGTVAKCGVDPTVALGRNRWVAPYCDTAQLSPTADTDLGAACYFVLECYAAARRKTAAGYFATAAVATLNSMIVNPMRPDVRGQTRAEELAGPGGIFRHVRVDGTPREPLRADNVRFQYVVGTSALSPSEGDWLDVVPGLVLYGRYLRVRLKLTEPTGWHQLCIPTFVVTARVLMSRTTGTATPEGSVLAPPGSLFTDTTLKRTYAKASGVGSTGWTALVPFTKAVEGYDSSIPANTIALLLGVVGLGAIGARATMPRAGLVKAFSWFFTGSHSAGWLKIRARKNGTASSTLELQSGASDTKGYTEGSGVTFAAGDDLAIEVDTEATWNGTSGTLYATAWVEFDPP